MKQNSYNLNRKLCAYFMFKLHAEKTFRSIKKNLSVILIAIKSKYVGSGNCEINLIKPLHNKRWLSNSNFYEIRMIGDFLFKRKNISFITINVFSKNNFSFFKLIARTFKNV